MTSEAWIGLAGGAAAWATLWLQQRKGVEKIGERLARLETQGEERAEASKDFRASVERRLDHIDIRVTNLERNRGQVA